MVQGYSVAAAKECIRRALDLIERRSNEQALRDNLTSYLRSIFSQTPVPGWVERHVRGAEAAVPISSSTGQTRGFVDNLVDLTAIEYEPDLRLRANFENGCGQVKDYCAALVNQGSPADLVVGVLSDTIHWFAYTVSPVAPAAATPLSRDSIDLIEIDRSDVSAADDAAAGNLIRFLSRHLGRLGARPLSGASIASDLGFDSPFCGRYLPGLASLVDRAFSDNPQYAGLISALWCSFVSYIRDQGSVAGFDRSDYADELYIMTLGKLICANVIERKALLSDGIE